MQTSFSVVFLSLFMVMAFWPVFAQANEAMYTVHNVNVDITADNALVAREKAFEQAQVQAFTELMDRLALGGDSTPDGEKVMPDPITLASMINDYEVTKEKLSSVRYIGTYTFRFKEDAVRSYFSAKDVRYTDTASEPLLVLPFYKKGNSYDLWSHENAWKSAWDHSDVRGGIVPVILPVGDLQDVRYIGDNEATSYAPASLENMLKRYSAKEAVLAIAVPDAGFADASSEEARGTLQVDLYRTDFFRPELVRQIFVTAHSGQSRDDVFRKAVREVRNVLSENWKEKSLALTAQQAAARGVVVHIPISSLQDWTVIQSKIRAASGIQDVQVRSLMPKKVTAVFLTGSDIRMLTQALARQGFNLRPLSTAVNPVTGEVAQDAEFELRYMRAGPSGSAAPAQSEMQPSTSSTSLGNAPVPAQQQAVPALEPASGLVDSGNSSYQQRF